MPECSPHTNSSTHLKSHFVPFVVLKEQACGAMFAKSPTRRGVPGVEFQGESEIPIRGSEHAALPGARAVGPIDRHQLIEASVILKHRQELPKLTTPTTKTCRWGPPRDAEAHVGYYPKVASAAADFTLGWSHVLPTGVGFGCSHSAVGGTTSGDENRPFDCPRGRRWCGPGGCLSSRICSTSIVRPWWELLCKISEENLAFALAIQLAALREMGRDSPSRWGVRRRVLPPCRLLS